jgi:hypothetical protein
MRYQQQTLWFIAEACYRRHLKLGPIFKTLREDLRSMRNYARPLTIHSRDLTHCDSYLWGSVEDKSV